SPPPLNASSSLSPRTSWSSGYTRLCRWSSSASGLRPRCAPSHRSKYAMRRRARTAASSPTTRARRTIRAGSPSDWRAHPASSSTACSSRSSSRRSSSPARRASKRSVSRSPRDDEYVDREELRGSLFRRRTAPDLRDCRPEFLLHESLERLARLPDVVDVVPLLPLAGAVDDHSFG